MILTIRTSEVHSLVHESGLWFSSRLENKIRQPLGSGSSSPRAYTILMVTDYGRQLTKCHYHWRLTHWHLTHLVSATQIISPSETPAEIPQMEGEGQHLTPVNVLPLFSLAYFQHVEAIHLDGALLPLGRLLPILGLDLLRDITPCCNDRLPIPKQWVKITIDRPAALQVTSCGACSSSIN